eukprot:3836990-Prymnesium_polylepis.1
MSPAWAQSPGHAGTDLYRTRWHGRGRRGWTRGPHSHPHRRVLRYRSSCSVRIGATQGKVTAYLGYAKLVQAAEVEHDLLLRKLRFDLLPELALHRGVDRSAVAKECCKACSAKGANAPLSKPGWKVHHSVLCYARTVAIAVVVMVVSCTAPRE